MLKCSDCYEENEENLTTCKRCGRLLQPVTYGTSSHKDKEFLGDASAKFETQHADAPNVMRRDRSVYRTPNGN